MIRYSLMFFFVWVFSPAWAGDKQRPVCSTEDLQELPQIFYVAGDETLIRWIEAGEKQEISSKHTPDFSERVALLAQQYSIPLQEALRYAHQQHVKELDTIVYDDVDRWLAISDIHGQYELFVELLKRHGVIDESLNWVFGNGHLIINGDIMDRGDGVTETLWLAFKLQQQAPLHHGKVHYNMGNHELMVLDGDVRYINKKYTAGEDILGATYAEQFSDKTFFGKWMRQQTIMFKINNVGFVHGGISPDLVGHKLTPLEVNRLFRDSIFTQEREGYLESGVLDFLVRTDGPLWYRGYFNKGLSDQSMTDILSWWDVDHIVVGHTSQKEIISLFDGRIIAIDASIKNGRKGEVLIYDRGQFFRGLLDGSRQDM